MKDDNKKVIMVDGKRSEWYEKAIFIMRSDINTESKPMDFVNEAEKIINSYMMKAPVVAVKEKKIVKKKISDDKLSLILNFALILSLVLLGITIYSLLA